MGHTANGSELASFDADDSLIQELLAGIPSTAWLPTDPLTSEDWFPDPSSSVITQDYPLQTMSQPASEAAFQHSGTEPLAGSSAAAAAAAVAAATAAKTPVIGSGQTPAVGSSSKDLPIGLGTRLTGNARAKQGTPGTSRRSSSNVKQRSNPLNGFAKKHGIGYAVGNQMAILSPELLSSSPPKRKQLMQNPYKYYSPPKPLLPRPSSQAKGRNLGLGTRVSRPSQSTATAAAQSAQRQRVGEKSGMAKWAIAQDKLLLRGVRLQRWRHGTARDPSRFAAGEWEQISQEVTRGGVARSARQCRRRWAVMYQHLGNAIMDFVDSTPTPQSSTQSTPAPPASITSGTADGRGQMEPRHARNLRFSSLPQSSPPLVADGREGLAADLVPIDLQSLNIEDRWSTPAYCQLLADVVQAMTNPQSKAADVVRRHVSQSDAHINSPAKLPQGLLPRQTDSRASRLISESLAPSTGNSISLLPTQTSGKLPSEQVCNNLQKEPSIVASSSSGGGLASSSSKSKAALAPQGVRVQSTEPLRSVPLGTHTATSRDMSFESTLSSIGMTSGVTSQPIASGEGVGLPTGSLDLGVGDQDLSVYLEFIQSLTNDQIDLNSAWTSLLDDSTGNNVAPLGSGATASISAAPSELSLPPTTSVARSTQENRISVDDDDASDGDFVLNDSEDADDDDDDYEEDAENEPDTGREPPQLGALGKVSQADNAAPSLLSTYSGGSGENSWEMALHQLGLATSAADTSFASTLPNPNSSGTGSDLVPDALIQQLMQGVADTSSGETQGAGAANASQATWLPSIAADSNILSQLGFGDSSGAGPSGSVSAATDLPQKGAQAEEHGQAAGEATTAAAPGDAPGTVPRLSSRNGARDTDALDARGVHRSHSHQSNLQRPGGETTTPSKRGMFKAARKLTKKPASTSLVKALMMDGLGANDIDTEMDGLFQDALQEGEDLDVQEESLSMDHGALLFTADQLALLREQQMQNFQFVSQAFLISCAETSPHAERSRHWKRQLDQLALWHSLGTRESPSDLMSPGGLRAFGDLIESAERQPVQSGAVAITASGRFAPNPASFFAIPGITAVVPDIYEAVDEIHRATQLSGDIEKPEGERIARVRRPAPGAQPVVRSYDSNVNFTAQCRCTPIAPLHFKSALVLECVFPRMHLELRNGKRKAADADSPENSKQQALLPRSDSGDRELATLPGMKPLAPLVKPMPRNMCAGPGTGDIGVRRASRDGSGLALIKPAATSEG
ncbi:hypothetical protein H4R20_004864, partial [Coemansia guatemalensis]